MQVQRATEAPKPLKVHGEHLYYLGINDEHERRICEAWLDAQNAKLASENIVSKARYVTELNTLKLDRDHVVRVLMRREKKLTQALPLVRNQHGIKELAESDDAALAQKIVECEEVRCADHWIEDGSEGGEGELCTRTFLEALGKTCTPACIKWKDDVKDGRDYRKLRLGWA